VDTVLYILGLLLLFGVSLAALASLLFGLPGTFLLVGAAAIYGWASGFAGVTWSTVGWLLLLAAIAEAVEFVAGAAAAGGTRPSRRVTAAALVGGIAGGLVGTPFLFGVGSLLGALAGAFTGAALAVASEGGSIADAFTTGLAAMRGRLLGFVLKSAIAVLMVVILFAAAI
jgi:hypothetical protein